MYGFGTLNTLFQHSRTIAKFRYPQWAGLYENKDQKIYVNRGLGHLGYAGRVGIYPEISILKIYS